MKAVVTKSEVVAIQMKATKQYSLLRGAVNYAIHREIRSFEGEVSGLISSLMCQISNES